MKVSAGIVCLLLTGCGAMPICEKKSLRSEYEHISHPEVNPPNEDTLDQLSLIGNCRNGRLFIEAGIGRIVSEGGFYGPDTTFTGRVGYYLFEE